LQHVLLCFPSTFLKEFHNVPHIETLQTELNIQFAYLQADESMFELFADLSSVSPET